MTPAEFKDALRVLSLTQAEAAGLFKVNERTVRSWIGGRAPVQEGVAIALRLMIKHGERTEKLAQPTAKKEIE